MSLQTILHMTASMLLYVFITALLWLWVRGKPSGGKGMKAAIGLIYGACSVAATHFGADYGPMVLNVRDMGPLAAGLFFSPASGIIAGLVGGAERILAGELWGIGQFTEIACGLSTFMAGVIAAILNKAVYQGRRPAAAQCFFLGAVTEVFHMYAILFTNRYDVSYAYYIVKTVSIPMIAFTSVGFTLCSSAIRKLNREPSDFGWKVTEEQTPLTLLFQRSLLMVTMGLFIFNFIVSYNFQTRLVNENASREMEYLAYEKETIYTETGNFEALKGNLAEQTADILYWMVDPKTGNVQIYSYGGDSFDLEKEDLEIFREHIGSGIFKTYLKTIQNLEFMCVVREIGTDYWLVILQAMATVYEDRDSLMYENTLSDILLFTVLYVLIAMLADRLVVRNLARVNSSLNRITSGHLDESVWVHTSSEFTELSEDINKTVAALRGYIAAAEKKMEDELKFAATIQESALPKNFRLYSENIELHALMTPAKQVGGDFYDFFYINGDKLCLVIADVSGKGIPASLFMMQAKAAIKNQARSGKHPAEVLQKVNNTLCEGNSAEMFVTVWLGILDVATGRMECANAGHEYPVLMRAGGDYELVKDRHGLVLAAMEDIPMRGYELQLHPGDRLFVYTDGVPEAVNEKNEAYGTDRLVGRLNKRKNDSQERTLEDILQDIRNFAGTAEQFDDITMLGLTYRYTTDDAAKGPETKGERGETE